MSTEADTCRKYVLPKLIDAGWDNEPHSLAEQRTFTDGRIVVAGKKIYRRPKKRADYLLRYTRDYPIAVIEVKASHKSAGQGVQQAKDYAEILGLQFAYATNGPEIIEFDFITGLEKSISGFPSPAELWARVQTAAGLTPETTQPAACPLLPSQRQKPPLLPGNRHQPGRAGHPPRPAPGAAHHGHRHRQDRRGLSNLLEALVLPLESHRGTSAPQNPLPRRPQYPYR